MCVCGVYCHSPSSVSKFYRNSKRICTKRHEIKVMRFRCFQASTNSERRQGLGFTFAKPERVGEGRGLNRRTARKDRGGVFPWRVRDVWVRTYLIAIVRFLEYAPSLEDPSLSEDERYPSSLRSLNILRPFAIRWPFFKGREKKQCECGAVKDTRTRGKKGRKLHRPRIQPRNIRSSLNPK